MTKKLSVWDCTISPKDKNTLHPKMRNVHYDHEEKAAVGSDGYVMFVSHDEYKPLFDYFPRKAKDENGEGVTEMYLSELYDRNNNPVEGTFVDYKRVIPKDETLAPITLISSKELKERIAEAVQYATEHGRRENYIYIFINLLPDDEWYNESITIEQHFVRIDIARKILAAKTEGNWFLGDHGISYLKKFDNGDILLTAISRFDDGGASAKGKKYIVEGVD